jgi:hypothetical protein
MSETPKPQPQRSEAGDHARTAREIREAAALRANLQRRKAQARDRDKSPPADPKS